MSQLFHEPYILYNIQPLITLYFKTEAIPQVKTIITYKISNKTY